MPRQNRSKAKAATRDMRPYLVAAFVALMLMVLAASQAQAQQKGAPTSDILIDMIDTCGLIVDVGADAESDLIADGWSVDDVYQNGPYSLEISASKIFSDDSDAYAFGVIENYPTVDLGFCSLDIQGLASTVDLYDVTDTYAVDGAVSQDEYGYWHGSWEMNDGDSIYLLLVHYEEENQYLLVQMNRIGGGTGASGSVK